MTKREKIRNFIESINNPLASKFYGDVDDGQTIESYIQGNYDVVLEYFAFDTPELRNEYINAKEGTAYVYFILGPNICKIGHATDLHGRFRKYVGDAPGYGHRLIYLIKLNSKEDAKAEEKIYHTQFAEYRMLDNSQTEWFAPIKEVKKFIRFLLQQTSRIDDRTTQA